MAGQKQALGQLDSAEKICERLADLLGPPPLSDGLLHPAAVAQSDEARAPRVMRINESTPKSEHDFFLLNVGRARAEAIVTTGKILREEPGLDFALRGPGQLVRGLHDLRRVLLSEERPPVVLILTSGQEFDFDHGALHGWARPLLYTSEKGRARLLPGAETAGFEVVAAPAPSLANAIGELRRRGLRRITVEAGPSTALALYRPPAIEQVPVDELLLSTFLGSVPLEVEGEPFLAADGLARGMNLVGGAEIEEPSGRWRFERWRRR